MISIMRKNCEEKDKRCEDDKSNNGNGNENKHAIDVEERQIVQDKESVTDDESDCIIEIDSEVGGKDLFISSNSENDKDFDKNKSDENIERQLNDDENTQNDDDEEYKYDSNDENDHKDKNDDDDNAEYNDSDDHNKCNPKKLYQWKSSITVQMVQ